MSTKPYKAIDCSFHDELEAVAVMRKDCTIHFIDGSNAQQKYQGKILDFYIKDKVEYMVMEAGLETRLDHIISLDGKLMPEDSTCGI